MVAQDENVGVSNVKLILPLDQKLFLAVVLRFVFVDLEDEETQFLLVLVGQNEIGLFFLLVDDFLDCSNVVLFVNVDLLLRFDVQVQAVVWRRNHEDLLVLIWLEKLRLPVQRGCELVDHLQLLSFKIKLEDFINLGKY